MIFRVVFGLLASLMLAGCGAKPQANNEDRTASLSSDSVWYVVKGQQRTIVSNILLQKGLSVKEDAQSNSLIGIANRSIRWLDADWDVVLCRFDKDNNLHSVVIMRSGEFDNGDVAGDSLYNVLFLLQQKFGEAQNVAPDEWVFLNTHNTTASIKQDRSTNITIVWE